MTPTQVKTLLDSGVLQAYAEGKPIQVRRRDIKDSWNDYRYHAFLDQDSAALEDASWEWRVKPEKKTGWIVLHDHPQRWSTMPFPTRVIALTTVVRQGIVPIACIQITYEEGEGL